ncbi:hypothetical protein NUSPORA_00673 [Nucleospora cyclopteri]
MLDITLFRDSKEIEKIKKSEANRFKDPIAVDKIAELDKLRISKQFQFEQICKKVNINQKQMATAIKSRSKDESVKEIVEKFENLSLKNEKEALKNEVDEITEEIGRLLNSIGNILDEKVPVCKTEDGNVTVRTYKEKDLPIKKLPFSELMESYTNSQAGSEVFGHRGYFLEGKMALLATALKFYAIKFLNKHGYTSIQTPVLLKKSVMAATAQLADFDEQLYHVSDQDMYLIATSEQPLTSLFMNKRLTDSDLPKMYAGESLCFRKEAGAYGKDNAGIFRVHQFEKIEQFVICKAEESQEFHEKMIKLAEEFYKTLEIPFRTVLIASGEMNDAAALKYDLEAWFPQAQKYRELVSASNCTDYQSRNLNVFYNYPEEGKKPQYVHMLNATLCAVQRTLCCIVENYQTEDGRIEVPKVLKEFLDFDFI